MSIDQPALRALALALMLALPGCLGTAEQTILACTGALHSAALEHDEPKSYEVKVDLEKRVVTVGDYAPAPIIGNDGDDLSFGTAEATPLMAQGGVSSGSINRFTGAVSMVMFDGNLRMFLGNCKPASTMF